MFLGISIATWIKLAPRVVALVKFFVAVVIGYSVLNKVDPLTAAVSILEKMKAAIPHPKKFAEWTDAERDAWFRSADGSGSGPNGGP